MSIIIRLQNLPWEANSLDIRRFFQGLSIPDGGVHIVGGEKGDAFIAFASDEDARQAMGRDGGAIKESRIKLLLSSRNEMQKVIELARNQTLGLKSAEPVVAAPAASALVPGLLPTPLQNSVVTAPIQENDRHCSPNRSRRRSRSAERDRFRNRSRSRRLPFNVIPRDIQDFFRIAGILIPEENIKILVDGNGYTTGGAVVHLSSERDFDSALSLNGRYMSDRRIDVMPLIDNIQREQNDLLRQTVPAVAIAPQTVGRTLLPEPLQLPKRDYVVYMKGIPYNSCTDRDIAAFFGLLRIVDIVLEVDVSGKNSGNAFVEFATREDFNAALELNMKHMGRRYIEVFPTTKEDMLEAKRVTNGPVYIDQPHSTADTRQTYCVNVTGLPQTVTNRDLTNYFLEVGAQPYAIHIMLKPNGFNAGEAFVEFVNAEHQIRALRKDGDSIGSHRIAVKAVAYEIMRSIVQPNNNAATLPMPTQEAQRSVPLLDLPENRSREKQQRLTRGVDDSRRNRDDRGDRRLRSEPFGDARCVVLATNIPYRATIEDICVFFADYNITPDCVMRRFNDKGQPTADSKICFRSSEDANRAVRQMHKKFLIERPVFLRHAI
ncbi:RNA-binding-like protein 2 [Leptotrombidium deliense]|uniref:RNA-binding-like protein 2 n=1 Tax=Leptotrombidium deliense TaxID=299467 RepID=A0A443SLN7_9ACAR|nr:RNA-binding-like protein 2 [Leptotrombidium deliense]